MNVIAIAEPVLTHLRVCVEAVTKVERQFSCVHEEGWSQSTWLAYISAVQNKYGGDRKIE